MAWLGEYVDPKLTPGPEIRYYLKIRNFYQIFLRLGQNDHLFSWSFWPSCVKTVDFLIIVYFWVRCQFWVHMLYIRRYKIFFQPLLWPYDHKNLWDIFRLMQMYYAICTASNRDANSKCVVLVSVLLDLLLLWCYL